MRTEPIGQKVTLGFGNRYEMDWIWYVTWFDPFVDLFAIDDMQKCWTGFFTQMFVVDHFLKTCHTIFFIFIVIVNAYCQTTVRILNCFTNFQYNTGQDFASLTIKSVRGNFTRYSWKMFFLLGFFYCCCWKMIWLIGCEKVGGVMKGIFDFVRSMPWK